MSKIKLILLIVVAVNLFGIAFGQTIITKPDTKIQFKWDANLETDLAGYRLYSDSNANAFLRTSYEWGGNNAYAEIDAGKTDIIVDPVGEGIYYFVLTAFDVAGNESGPTDACKVIVDFPPKKPGGFGCFGL